MRNTEMLPYSSLLMPHTPAHARTDKQQIQEQETQPEETQAQETQPEATEPKSKDQEEQS